MGRHILRAAGWAAFSRFAIQLVNWAATLIVLRFLRPEDYGLMATTMAITGFLQSISMTGFADALIQSKNIDAAVLRSLFGLVIVINLALFCLLFLLSYELSWLYGEPRLLLLLQAASFIFVINIFNAIPNSMLMKALDLKRVSRVDISANVAGSLLVLFLAWNGFGVWALMAGFLGIALLRAIGLNMLFPFLDAPRFDFAKQGSILRFGGLRTGEQLLWYAYSSADVLILGKLLGNAALGVYSVARDLAAIPVEKLATVIKPVAFPAFARLQDDRREALGYLSQANAILAFITFPIFFGMAAISEEVVALVLGSAWAGASIALHLLALGMLLRPIGLIIPSFLQGIGEIRASFNNTLLAAILFPTAFAIGSFWGVSGVCIAWIVAYPIQFFSLMRRVAIVTEVSIFSLVRPLLLPLAGAAAMYVGVSALRLTPVAEMPLALRTTILIGCGVILYAAFALLFCKPLIGKAKRLVRG